MKLSVLLCVLAGVALTACPAPENADTQAADTTADVRTPAADTNAEEPAVADTSAAAPTGAAVGSAAPDFTLTDYAGTTHSLSKYTAEGKVVVLEWFSPKCGAVNAYYKSPDFAAAMAKEFEGKDVVWLAVNSSGEGKPGYERTEVEAWLTEHKKSTPILVDASGATGHAYGVEATPHVFVIDAGGKVAYSGAFDEASGGGDAPKGTNHVVNAVNAVLGGQPVPVTQTKANG
jgi:peroxiredoxin